MRGRGEWRAKGLRIADSIKSLGVAQYQGNYTDPEWLWAAGVEGRGLPMHQRPPKAPGPGHGGRGGAPVHLGEGVGAARRTCGELNSWVAREESE